MPASNLLKSRLAFLVVSAVQRAIPFALLPLFVSYLSPTEYGHVGVLTAAFTLGSMTFGLGQELVLYRYFFSEEDADRRALSHSIATQVTAPLVLAGTGALILLVVRPDIGGTPPHAIALSLMAAGIYCASWQYTAISYRCREETTSYFALSLLYTATVGAAKVVLILVFGAGATGWAMADVIGSVVLALLTTPLVRKALAPVRRDWDRRDLGKVLALGLPIAASQLARWASGFSDRIWIVVLLTPAAAGSYLVAAQFVTIGNIFIIELARFLQPTIARRDRPLSRLLLEIVPKQVGFATVIAIGVAVFGFVVLELGFASQYAGVLPLIAVLSISIIFAAVNYVAGDINAIYLGNTKWLAGVSIGVGLLCVASNYVLITSFGIWGAAITAVGGQAVTAVLLSWPIIKNRNLQMTGEAEAGADHLQVQ